MHVDWERGIILRQRKKTGSPQVHKLWAVTLKLLKEEATKPSESPYVLLDERGGPLVKESEECRTDCLQRAFNRLKHRLGWSDPHKTHSAFRDTGASWLKEQYPMFPTLASQYLGHKVAGVITHYTPKAFDADSPHYAPLFSAIDCMGEFFGLSLT